MHRRPAILDCCQIVVLDRANHQVDRAADLVEMVGSCAAAGEGYSEAGETGLVWTARETVAGMVVH